MTTNKPKERAKRSATVAYPDHPVALCYKAWWDVFCTTVRGNRGMPSQLARDLGLPRQTVHRWLTNTTKPPAWAGWAMPRWAKQALPMMPSVQTFQKRPPGE